MFTSIRSQSSIVAYSMGVLAMLGIVLVPAVSSAQYVQYPYSTYQTAPVTYPTTYSQGYTYPAYTTPVAPVTMGYAGYAGSTGCMSIVYDLTVGSQGAEVTNLQNFLLAQGYFQYTATGHYGVLTAAAVRQYQAAHGLAVTGSVGADTKASIQQVSCGGIATQPYVAPYTGVSTYPYNTTPQYQTYPYTYPYGGVATRPTIYSISPQSGGAGSTITIYGTGFTSNNAILFNGTATTHVGSQNSGTMITATIPVASGATCNYGYYGGYNSYNYNTYNPYNSYYPYNQNQYCPDNVQSWPAGVYSVSVQTDYGTSNALPFTLGGTTNTNVSVSGVDAPSSIAVGQIGTWTVRVTNQNSYYGYGGNQLSYSVTWGDENVYGYGVAQASPYNQQSATFTHTYYQRGTYNPTFRVTNQNGQVSTVSSTVTVY